MLKDLKFKIVGIIFSVAFALVGILSIISVLIIDENVSLVRESWQTYQIDRSDKAKLTSILQAEIGYGGAIHHFKNFILRNEIRYFEEAKKYLIAANATIEQFYLLNVTEAELEALNHIQQTFESYDSQLSHAKSLFAQGKTSKEVDELVYVDDSLAFQGIRVLSAEQVTLIQEQSKSKYSQIVSLRSILGYGGFIHHFKNAVLRSDLNKLLLAKEQLQKALLLLKEYQLLKLTQKETNALFNINKTLQKYLGKVDEIQQLIQKNTTPIEIDSQVIVNDLPALQGLIALEKEINLLTQTRSLEVSKVLGFLTTLVKVVTQLMIYITAFLVLLSLWIIRYRLIDPVSQLIGNMKRLAKGDFNVAIKGTEKENEIGEMARSIEVFRDSAQKRLAVETKIKTILKSAIDGIVTINSAGMITSFNPAAEKLFGHQENFILGKNVSILMPEPHKSKHDKYIRDRVKGKPARIMGEIVQQEALKKSGEIFPVEISLNEMKIDNQIYFTAIIRDTTERVKREKEIQKMALCDALTGIANRYQFEAKLSEATTMALRTKTSVGLVLIDLDKFKPVNDSYGHQVGDLLLKEVASRLDNTKRDTDTVARIGGDEFAIILNHLKTKECIKVALARYQELLLQPYFIDGYNLDIGVSIGFSTFPQDDTNLDELFRLADDAMYQAKKGSNRG